MKWLRVLAVGLVAFLAFACVHALLPSRWTGQLAAPAGQTGRTVVFHCGPLWGSAYAHGPSSLPYPVAGTPCGSRTDDQVMTVVDISVAVFAIAVLAGWQVRRSRFHADGTPDSAIA